MPSVYSKYPMKWQERFAFLDANGAPNTPTFKQAFKALPFMQRVRISRAICWRSSSVRSISSLSACGAALVGLAVTVAVIVLDVVMFAIMGADSKAADIISRALGLGIGLSYCLTANYAYYLKEVKGKDGWNFFEGLRM